MTRNAVRKMPTEGPIRRYWCQQLWLAKGFDSPEEFLIKGTCFACGFDFGGGLHRSHITARCKGGADEVSNLHMLCRSCHTASEYLDGDKYWQWFYSRTLFYVVMQQAAMECVDIPRAEPDPRRLLSVEEIAGFLGVCPRTVKKWVAENRIPYVNLGGVGEGPCLRFRMDSILAWLEERETKPEAPK